LYDHAGVPSPCSSCHNGTKATGIAQFAGHTAIGTNDCNACHTTTATWSGATGAMPSNHIQFTAGTTCNICHTTSTTTVKGAALHTYLSSSCKTCHDSKSPVYAWTKSPPDRKTLGNHEKSTTAQDCTSCHTRVFTKWSGA
jgi:hypothetical protein